MNNTKLNDDCKGAKILPFGDPVYEKDRSVECMHKENEELNHFYYSPSEEAKKLPFALCGAGHNIVLENHYIEREGLDYYELLITINGSGTVTVDGVAYNATKGSTILIDCHKTHTYQTSKCSIWEYKYVHFSNNSNDKLVNDCLGLMDFVGSADQYFDDLNIVLNCIDINSEYIFSNIISNILTSLIVLKNTPKKICPYKNEIEEAAAIMKREFNQDINISNIAKNSFISVYYFIRLFKEYNGLSPYCYLTRYRVSKAKEFLLMGLSLEEISFRCGFKSTDNFLKIFKRHACITPTMYRKQYKNASVMVHSVPN